MTDVRFPDEVVTRSLPPMNLTPVTAAELARLLEAEAKR